ncbi:MAG: fibronectin type III domain-containing protein [Oscillospiraceae bacterium]|nr:fibronectin type III domain-containing protein [Oscillospiraceae bacterium]
MKVLKKLMVMALVLFMTAGLFHARSAQAATKPAKAKVTVKANDDGKSVTLTISKTKNAEGYKIMVKKPGASKFTKLTTLKKDGTAARTYTAKKLTEGEYQFKVRAYLKNGSKTVWGKYSKVAKITVGKSGSDDKKDDNTGSETGAASEFSKANQGDIITFGAYEQDNDTDNGKEPIEWIVLSNNGSELLVLSKYALDYRSYNGGEYAAVTWETCKIRKWLNDEFYNAAFDNTDKSKIKTTVVKTADHAYGTPGGNATEDKVFLLSREDMINTDYGFVNDCWDDTVNRRCALTEYAQSIMTQGGMYVISNKKTADGEPASYWWLRSPGMMETYVVDVNDSGAVNESGYSVNTNSGVRPALTIKLK